jgi:hypothetical protein
MLSRLSSEWAWPESAIESASQRETAATETATSAADPTRFPLQSRMAHRSRDLVGMAGIMRGRN